MGKSVFKSLFKSKLRASSMIEVIISFVICLIIFTISMRFILAVEIQSNTKSKQQAIILISNAENMNALDANQEYRIWLNELNLKMEIDTLSTVDYNGLAVVEMLVTHTGGKLVKRANFLTRRN